MQIKTSVTAVQKTVHRTRIVLTASIYLLMLAYAVSVTMLGPMMSVLIKGYQLKVSQGGLIATFQNIGGFAAVALGMVFADRIRKSKLISAGFAIYAMMLFVIGFAHSSWALMAAFFILGAGGRTVDTIASAYIVDLHPEKSGMYLNLLHSFFSAGAFIGPLYSRFLLDNGLKWNQAFLYLSVICMVILFLFIFFQTMTNTNIKYVNSVNMQTSVKTNTFSIRELVLIIKNPGVWVLCAMTIVYSGHQSGLTIWLPMYMETLLKTTPFISSMALSLFWIGIIIGRLICSWLSRKIDARSLILWGNLFGGVFLILGILSKQVPVLLVSVGMSGLLTGFTFPMILVIACSLYPGNSGSVSSLISLNSLVAWMVFPWVIGVIAERSSFQYGMLLTGIMLLAVFVLSLIFSPHRKAEICS